MKRTTIPFLAAVLWTGCTTGAGPAGSTTSSSSSGAAASSSAMAASLASSAGTSAGGTSAGTSMTVVSSSAGSSSSLGQSSSAGSSSSAPESTMLTTSSSAGASSLGAASSGPVSSSSQGGSSSSTGAPSWCSLPGSIQFTANGTVTVPGGPPQTASLSFLHLPQGFCAHHFGNVGNARQLRFAPGGDLFVASPTTGTTGGGPNGQAAIVVLPDDNQDGVADVPQVFLSGLPSTQGLLFSSTGFFYFQDATRIRRLPFVPGSRTPDGSPETVATISIYSSALHWPKPLDEADDGTIYVGNGGDQGEACVAPHPFHGGILQVDAAPGAHPGGVPVSQGFRNPISVRCQRGHNRCYALELARDYTATSGGREKLVPIRQGDDWGFPCCATTNLPYLDSPAGTQCSSVTEETNSWLIGDTPFGLAFEDGQWPAPYRHGVFVAAHGAAGSWTGTRVSFIETDPVSGEPLASTNTTGMTTGAMHDFAVGWDDGTLSHGRAAAVEFSPDGRLFVSNDTNGAIFWIAPL